MALTTSLPPLPLPPCGHIHTVHPPVLETGRRWVPGILGVVHLANGAHLSDYTNDVDCPAPAGGVPRYLDFILIQYGSLTMRL